MPVTQEGTQDISLWWLIALCFVGALAGELHRLSALDIPWRQIFKRVFLRYGASALAGGAASLFARSYGASSDVVMGIGIIVSLLGADTALALYNSSLRRKLGIEASTPATSTTQAPSAESGQQ